MEKKWILTLIGFSGAALTAFYLLPKLPFAAALPAVLTTAGTPAQGSNQPASPVAGPEQNTASVVDFLLLRYSASLNPQRSPLSKQQIDAMLAETAALQQEVYALSDFLPLLEEARKNGDWQALIDYLSTHRSSTTFRSAADYSITDVLVTVDAPVAVIKSALQSYPPTLNSLFTLVNTQSLRSNPALLHSLLSYFAVTELRAATVAGVDNLDLLALAQQNQRQDIISFYAVTDITATEMAAAVAKLSNKPAAVQSPAQPQPQALTNEMAPAGYYFDISKAVASDYCRQLNQTLSMGIYPAANSKFQPAPAMLLAAQAYQLNKTSYQQLAAKQQSRTDLPATFQQAPDRYQHSLVLFALSQQQPLPDNNADYLPDSYAIGWVSMDNYQHYQADIIQRLLKQVTAADDRLAIVSNIYGGLQLLKQLVAAGVQLQPSAAEDVLHISIRNEDLAENLALQQYLTQQQFRFKQSHQQMLAFKQHCLVDEAQ